MYGGCCRRMPSSNAKSGNFEEVVGDCFAFATEDRLAWETALTCYRMKGVVLQQNKGAIRLTMIGTEWMQRGERTRRRKCCGAFSRESPETQSATGGFTGKGRPERTR